MFYTFNIFYWISTISLMFTEINKAIFSYDISAAIQCLFFILSIIWCVCIPNQRKVNILLWTVLHYGFSFISDLFIKDVMALYFIIETTLFICGASFIALNPITKSDRNINKDNILLAFYNGNNGSVLMRVASIFNNNVQSVCVLAGDKALYLKHKEPAFIFGDSDKFHRSHNYIIKDTGVKVTSEFLQAMKEHEGIKAKRFMLRSRCIEAISDLLGMIGDEFKPTTNAPSVYLRGI